MGTSENHKVCRLSRHEPSLRMCEARADVCSLTRQTTVFIRALGKLSAVSVDDIPFAHQKLFQQVNHRQKKRTHPEHYAREALSSDIDHTIQEIKRLIDCNRYQPKQQLEELDDSEDGDSSLDLRSNRASSSGDESGLGTIVEGSECGEERVALGSE